MKTQGEVRYLKRDSGRRSNTRRRRKNVLEGTMRVVHVTARDLEVFGLKDRLFIPKDFFVLYIPTVCIPRAVLVVRHS